jgi:integrase
LLDFANRKKEILNTGLQKSTTDFEATTFNAEADYWLQVKSAEFSKGYFRVLSPSLKMIRSLYGHYPIARFTPSLLIEFRNHLRDKGLSISTQNRYTDIITRIISFSFSQKRINLNPCLGHQKQREIIEDMKFWSSKEIERFLLFADSKYPRGSKKRWIYIAYLYVLETGVRANELWGIKIFDLPESGAKMRISRQVSGNNSFTPTKGKDVRSVPLSSSLRKEIEDWILFCEITNTDRTLFVTTLNPRLTFSKQS